MSETTDTTQVLPLAASPRTLTDPDATVSIPVIVPVAPAVPIVPPEPAFDPVRARLVHLHRVLGRILGTASLPAPDRADLHAYGNGIELLLHDDLDGSALKPYGALFGGTPTGEDRASAWAESGMQRYAELLTVVDGVEVRAWSLTDLPAVEQTVPQPEAVPDPTAAAEPEPEHAPAPAPQPTETPAEHPEAA